MDAATAVADEVEMTADFESPVVVALNVPAEQLDDRCAATLAFEAVAQEAVAQGAVAQEAVAQGAVARGCSGVLLCPPSGSGFDTLGALRFHIRLAHERSLRVWMRIDWAAMRPGLGDFDVASLEIGRSARSLAHELHSQIPEVDGIFLDWSPPAPPLTMPELSGAFFEEFCDRTGFSGRKYRLEDRLADLTEPGTAAARVRCDFANTCEDLAFRLLSNLATEAAMLFGKQFALALASDLPTRLVPRPLDWMIDYHRFAALYPLVFESTDHGLGPALARSIAQYNPGPIFVCHGNEWRSLSPSRDNVAMPPNVAVIINARAPMVDCRFAQYLRTLDDLITSLTTAGYACDLLTPQMMTTSEMTDSGGFRYGENEYTVAIYPWPTIHTPYQWRELNGYLDEQGRAIFFGPGPMCLTDGTILDEEAKGIFRKATRDESEIVAALFEMNLFNTSEPSSVEQLNHPATEQPELC